MKKENRPTKPIWDRLSNRTVMNHYSVRCDEFTLLLDLVDRLSARIKELESRPTVRRRTSERMEAAQI